MNQLLVRMMPEIRG